MIQGLVVTIQGAELKQLCEAQAVYHENRATVYQQQINSMKRNEIQGMNYTAGDPLRNLQDRMFHHADEAQELAFIAAHLELAESYRLERHDLSKLGVCKGRERVLVPNHELPF